MVLFRQPIISAGSGLFGNSLGAFRETPFPGGVKNFNRTRELVETYVQLSKESGGQDC